MGGRSADKVKFTSYDDLFGSAEVVAAEEDRSIRVPLGELHSFKNHPFHVLDDEKMMDTVRSIRQYGVLVPEIVRQDGGGGDESVAGYRRKRGSELAGCRDMPVIVRKMTDDEATIVMVDSNIQREDILPSEKAWVYRMNMEALSHQGVKGEDYTANLVGEAAGDCARTVQRYIRLTYLRRELLIYVDQGKIVLVAAEKISFLSDEEQGWVLQMIQDNQSTVSKSQAEELREESSAGRLTEEQVTDILSRKTVSTSVTISAKRIRSYFPQDFTKKQIEEIIFRLLDSWKEKENQTGQLR